MFVNFPDREFRFVLEAVAEDDEDRVEVYGNAIGGGPEDMTILADRLERRSGPLPSRAAHRIRRAVRFRESRTPARR